MQKFTSFGRKKKKQTKIRHRMVMLEGLQLVFCSQARACYSVTQNFLSSFASKEITQ